MADTSNLGDSKSTNDCKEEDSNVITMLDVLEEEKMLEDDALAVLGASDDKNCTYSQVTYFAKIRLRKYELKFFSFYCRPLSFFMLIR